MSSCASRRSFITSAVAAATTIAVVGLDPAQYATAAAPEPEAHRAFQLHFDETVRVLATSGRRFELTVVDREGRVLERHRHLTARRVFMTRSEHFRVTRIAVPTSA